MKRSVSLRRYVICLLTITFCVPAHAMWRQVEQKIAAFFTAAARQRPFSSANLVNASKKLDPKIINAQSRLLTSKTQRTLPVLQSQLIRLYTSGNKSTAIANQTPVTLAKKANPLLNVSPILQDLKKTLTIARFNKNFYEIYLKYKDNPEAVKGIASFAAQNFTDIHTYIHAELIMHNRGIASIFIDPTLQVFKTTSVSDKFNWTKYEQILNMLLHKFPDKAALFEKALIETQNQTILKDLFVRFQYYVLLHKPDAAERFAQFSLKHFTELCEQIKREKGTPFFKAWFKATIGKDLASLQQFTDLALQQFEQIDEKEDVIKMVVEYSPNAKNLLQPKIKKWFTALRQQDPIAFLINLKWYQNLWGDFVPDACDRSAMPITTTVNHILSTPKILVEIRELINNPTIKDLLIKIVKEEGTFHKDYYTFVHGQRWEYYLPEKLFTDLYGYRHNIPVHDFIFAHVRTIDDKDKDIATHQRLLLQGRKNFDAHKDRQKLLFLNAPFFGNTFNKGSSTAHYFTKNANVGNVTLTNRQVFDLLGYGNLYTRYAQALEALEKEFSTLSNCHGNILFFAIPKKMAQKYVFVAEPGGYKKTIKINDKETDDINVIMDAYQNNPKSMSEVDRNEFCLIMANDAMNPQSGIKVKAINAANPEKMSAFWKKYDVLMAKIKADIEKNRKTLGR